MHRKTAIISSVAAAVAIAIGSSPTGEETTASYIVSGASATHAANVVTANGGDVTGELDIINGVVAELSSDEVVALRSADGVRGVFPNASVSTANNGNANGKDKDGALYFEFPRLVGADLLHDQGITGSGVTVAIVDSGLAKPDEVRYDRFKNDRLPTAYQAVHDRTMNRVRDHYGHGTHIGSIILNSSATEDGDKTLYNGMAPDASAIAVKAFTDQGEGNYETVIRGLDWILDNKDAHGIRVVNLSFSAKAQTHYWDDPINQAVMRLWQAGIVVVASAGNTGPDPMTIGVPGNNPYVITVGAISDNYTPDDRSDDFIASFSSAGPTYEGFVKPELVAPGGHITTRTNPKSNLVETYPEFHHSDKYFTISGTSQAAAVVTGTVALMLQADPSLTPDAVKCKLLASARPAMDASGELAYSVFRQGAGMLDAAAAIAEPTTDCANRGMDINLDLTGQVHYGGRAAIDEHGNFYLRGLDGFLWGDEGVAANGFLWSSEGVGMNGYLWSSETLWTDGYLWSDGSVGMNGYLWSDGNVTMDGFLWGDEGVGMNGFLWGDEAVGMNGYLWSDLGNTPAGVNFWVEQE